jgi:hypothetical protein
MVPMRLFFILVICVFLGCGVSAQTIPIGSPADGSLRAAQLNGQLDPTVSLTLRPIPALGKYLKDSLAAGMVAFSKPLRIFKGSRISLLPLSIVQQFNSHHPYGWNDGAMIAAKGYQTLLSAGVYAEVGPLELQLQPEFVFAANPAYESNNVYGNKTPSYQKFFPGQSRINLNVFSLSAGVSTQNIWWGPGIHSSLLMSNNAPGFLHGFFSSQHPVKTPIGSLEWQLIGAKIEANSNYGSEVYNLTIQSLSRSRYLSAYVVTYHPKWVDGLFLGMTRALQRYKSDLDRSESSFLNKYFPVLTKAFQKQNARADDTLHTDQLASFFLRWVFLKAKTEFYIEYGYNDYGYNVRDYIMSPTHSTAYLAGVKKLVPLAGEKYLDLNFEIIQMSQSPDYIVREAGNWYTHNEIKEGYTHENQILGAGAGLGTNVQTFTASWVNGAKKLGFMIERADRDPQYHSFNWVDISFGLLPQWSYHNLLFAGKLQLVHSSQYAWQQNVDRFNMHSRLTIQYVF